MTMHVLFLVHGDLLCPSNCFTPSTGSSFLNELASVSYVSHGVTAVLMHKRLCRACHRSVRSESAMPQEPTSFSMALLSAESEPWCNKNMLYSYALNIPSTRVHNVLTACYHLTFVVSLDINHFTFVN